MSTRIGQLFEQLEREKRCGMIAYLTAGDPTPEATPGLVAALERGGADLIELGVPFSDPIADGPVIQQAGDRAILFVRPESANLVTGSADTTLSSRVKNVAFEGNMTHVFLEGAGKKDITVTVGRHNGHAIPEAGAEAAISYDPSLGLVLPDGKLARE